MAVAVVQGGGVLVTVARTDDGEGWTPIEADAPSRWFFWPVADPAIEASPFAPRKAYEIATVATGSARCLAVATGMPQGIAPSGDIGIAVSSADARAEPVTAVEPASELGTWISARAARPFHRAEDEALTLEMEELPSRFPRFAERQKLPIVWTRIVRQGAAQAPKKTYYLEGYKDYEGFRGRVDVGRIRTTGHVFVQFDGRRETADAEVDLSDVEGRRSVSRLPLLVIHSGERALWTFRVRGYDDESYEIFELSGSARPPRVVAQAAAGC